MDILLCIVSLSVIGTDTESGPGQYLDHQVKSLTMNVAENQEQKVISEAMNQGFCSIARVALKPSFSLVPFKRRVVQRFGEVLNTVKDESKLSGSTHHSLALML